MIKNLPTNLQKFAEALVWHDCPERYIRTPEAYKNFLVFLLAHMPEDVITYAQKTFNITDADFIDALKTAKPGVFIYESEWTRCNDKLGIVPPLPFPRKTWSS